MRIKSYSWISLLFAAALASCSQLEEQIPTENEYKYTFKVADDALTKASYGENHIVFEKDDLVASYASTSVNKSAPVEVAEDGEKIITIKSSVALNAGDKVYAYYPYNSANDGASKTEVTLEIPRNQVSGDADAMPMVALPFTLTDAVNSDEATEVGTLEFLNLGSVIKLNIYSSDSKFQGETIENVTFIEEKPVAGSFTYDITSVDVENPAAISGYEETDVVVTGRATVGTSAEDAGVYYMVVAPGTYKGKFVVRTNKADYTYDSSAKEREYSRATVKPLNINLASTNWVANDKYDTSIDSPREFVAFLKGTSADDTAEYTISADLNMDGYTITSASGFGGTLNGGDHTISNLVSSVPMFAHSTGSFSNLTIDESCVFTVPVADKIFGTLVKKAEGGTYNAVVNKANVTCTATANLSSYIIMGGLVGTAYNVTFTNCENYGHVKFDATGYTHRSTGIGGLVGYTESSTYDSCVNGGPVTILGDYGDPNTKFDATVTGEKNPEVGINLGGIVGCGMDFSTASYCTFRSCENKATGVITFTHTKFNSLTFSDSAPKRQLSIGGILGRARGNMKNCKNYAPINVIGRGTNPNDYWSRLQYLFNIGGLAGAGRYAMSFESCVNEGDITVAHYQSKYSSAHVAAIGGICGWQDYDDDEILDDCADFFGYYCINRGSITVTGEGSAAVGGIFGVNGKQIGNKVTKSCKITYSGRDGFVGGLVGMANGNAYSRMVKSSTFEGTIEATRVYHGFTDDDRFFSVGGLIGYNENNKGEALLERDSQPCKFAGSVSCSNAATSIGMIVGCVNGANAIVIGNEGNPIQASGTFARKGLSSTTISSSNINSYAIGYLPDGHQTTIHVVAKTDPTLKVMSFNLRESNLDERMPAIIEMIRGEKPDVIGLQEVKVLTGWDAIFESDSWKAVLNGVDDIYDGYRPTGQTNGFLYNPEVVEVSNTGFFYLGENYNTSGTENSWDDWQRTAIYATLTYKATGKKIFFINTHYPLNLDGCKKSSTLVEERIAALNTNKYPVIVVGDFNQVLSSGAFEGFKVSMRDARTYADEHYSEDNKNIYTYNAFGDASAVRNKVDHIWYSHPALDAKYYETLTQEIRKYGNVEYLSDHYPITAVISF